MHGDADSQGEALPEHGSPEDLEQRLRLVPLGDTVRGVLFNSFLETVRQEGGAEAMERCLADMGESSFLSFFNYPVRSLLKLSYVVAWELSGKFGGFDGAMRRLGRGAVPDFFQSTVGAMMRSVAGMDAKRLISWIPIVYPAIYNHGTCKVAWTNHQSGLWSLSGTLLTPPFVESTMTHMLEPCHLTAFEARARRVGPLKTEVVFSWK